MCRNRMACGVAVLVVMVGAGAGEKTKTPAARVLEVKGKVTIVELDNVDRPAAMYGTIYADERLVVTDDSQVMLVFRGNGHVERIVARGTFKVTQNGCEPGNGLEQMPVSEQHRATISRISKDLRSIVQGGVVVVRAARPPGSASQPPQGSRVPVEMVPGVICPLPGSTLLEAKPKFSWPAVPNAKQYSLNLYLLGNQVWSANTEKTELEYAGQSPLTSGAMHTWEVTASVDGEPTTVCESRFRTASREQRDNAEALAELLAKPEPAHMVLAAMWYRENGLVREAIAVNEQLAKLTAVPAVYRELKELYCQANDEKQARAAEEKMMELAQKEE